MGNYKTVSKRGVSVVSVKGDLDSSSFYQINNFVKERHSLGDNIIAFHLTDPTEATNSAFSKIPDKSDNGSARVIIMQDSTSDNTKNKETVIRDVSGGLTLHRIDDESHKKEFLINILTGSNTGKL